MDWERTPNIQEKGKIRKLHRFGFYIETIVKDTGFSEETIRKVLHSGGIKRVRRRPKRPAYN